MFCYKCGNKLKEGGEFCFTCGTRILNPVGVAQLQIDGKGWFKKIPFFAVPIVLLGLFVLASFIFPGLDGTSDEADFYLGQIFGFILMIFISFDLVRLYKKNKKKVINCKKCNASFFKESDFCINCGEKNDISRSRFEKFLKSINSEKNIKFPNDTKSQIKILTGGIIGAILAYYLGSVVFIFIIFWAFGVHFGRWISKKGIDSILFKIVAWSNIITWLFPVLGVFTTFSILECSKKNTEMPKKYKIIAYIALFLSIVSALLGVLLRKYGYI